MTSIRLDEDTKMRLKKLKVAYGASSMNQLLSKICDAFESFEKKRGAGDNET